MTTLCMIRHGQTKWNIEGRYQGQSDVDLNEVGFSQAEKLALGLAGEKFDAIFSSDLMRAKNTALAIARQHNLDVKVDRRLREIHQGEWEGLLVQDIQEKYEEVWRQREIDPADMRPPGGESVEEVAARVYAALDDIALAYPQGRIAVVSHGLSIATVICKVNGIPIGLAYRSIPNNAAPTWVEWPVNG